MMLLHNQMILAAEAKIDAQKLWNQGGPQNGAEVSALKKSLSPLVGDGDACILAGAAGGAPVASSLGLFDARQSVEDACGLGSTFGFGGRSYEQAIEALKAVAPEAAHIVDAMSQGKSAESSKALNKQAKEDAKKVAKEVAEKTTKVVAAATATAAAGYTLYVVGGIAVALIVARLARGK